MSDQPETLAAILAEMRDPCAPRAHSLPALADRIEAALAAPPRNCDVGTAEDALAAYTKDRDLALSPEAQDAIWWLFEKAEKEETK